MANQENVTVQKTKMPNILNSFVDGARKGLNLVLNVIVPNSIFAFSLMSILRLTGALDIIGFVLSPVMGLFGLPGEAAVPLVLAYISTSGGVVSGAALLNAGAINSVQATIMFPFIFLIGASMQYLGRILAPAGIATKHYTVCFAIATINAFASMIIMRLILMFA